VFKIYLGELQSKDIVNINDGKNLGRIIDVEIDEDGKIVSILIERKRLFKKFFGANNQYTITYKEINKIGDDVILISI